MTTETHAITPVEHNYDVRWEGNPLECDHCNAEIPSAYGEPDADSEDT